MHFIANVFLDVKKDNATLVKGSVGKIETLASGQKSAIGKGITRKQVLSKTMCEPNFSCPFCDAAFVRIDSMQSHLRQHQKLQPELQQDIFALQQQLGQQHNPQASPRPKIQPSKAIKITRQDPKTDVARRTNGTLLLATAQKPTCYREINTSRSPDKYPANINFVKNTSSAITHTSFNSMISAQQRAIQSSVSSVTPPSSSILSSPADSEESEAIQNNGCPVALIISADKTGKAFVPSEDIPEVSQDSLQGFSYITIPSSATTTTPTTPQNNALVSVPSQIPVPSGAFTPELSRAPVPGINFLPQL